MPRINVADMTPGQLKLHFASVCQYHQCSGVAALGMVHRFSEDALRGALVEYEAAKAKRNWNDAEAALLKLFSEATEKL